ncbi:MAG: hypothetical protein IPM74_16865 [Crocinitomicaceae bacterium]|nr:hypothetical protein [Crocinitomicaceae bacterium]
MRDWLIRYSVFAIILLSGVGSSSFCTMLRAKALRCGVARANMGVLGRNEFPIRELYRWSESVSQKTPNPYNITSADFNFVGTALSYGITNRITAEAELGYFINKSQHYTVGTTDFFCLRGLVSFNGYFTLKYGFKLGSEIIAGILLPHGFHFLFTTDYQIVDGV